MTETEWLVCTDPELMLGLLGGVNERKFKLFAVACWRAVVLAHFEDDSKLEAIQHFERHAEGELSRRDLMERFSSGWEAGTPIYREEGFSTSFRTAFHTGMPRFDVAEVARYAAEEPSVGVAAVTAFLGCVFGNPFRPVCLDPAWRTPTVVALAQAAYDDRILPAGTLDPDRLAVLADALDDAGCTDTDILSHLREPALHVRGCWVVDAILGKK